MQLQDPSPADPFGTDPFPTRPDDGSPLRRTAIDCSAPRSIPMELANHPDFELIKELGRGGMGVVYLVRNRLMNRLEVLKVVNNLLLDWHDSLERFQREMRAAASLSHANIVAAHSALRLGDLLVFAMEYVDGRDLWQVVRRRGRLPITNATFYVHQAALGLQHAHERGMVHRDIKPHNLVLSIVNRKHVVKILDFGLAKATREEPVDGDLTHSGQMLGTPHYIAPEQSLDAHQADIRADIYSLGCTLYFLLSGDAPFAGNSSLYEIMQAHDKLAARPLDQLRDDVPAELAAIVAKMMAKRPEERYQTPAEVARALGPFFKAGSKGRSSRSRTTAWPTESWPDLSFDPVTASSSRIRRKTPGSKRGANHHAAPMALGMGALAICSAAGLLLWGHDMTPTSQASTTIATQGIGLVPAPSNQEPKNPHALRALLIPPIKQRPPERNRLDDAMPAGNAATGNANTDNATPPATQSVAELTRVDPLLASPAAGILKTIDRLAPVAAVGREIQIPCLQVRQGYADFPNTPDANRAIDWLERFEYRIARGTLRVRSVNRAYELGDRNGANEAGASAEVSLAGFEVGKPIGVPELAAEMNVKDVRVELKPGSPWRWQIRVTRFTDMAQRDSKVAEKVARMQFISRQRSKAKSACGTQQGHEAMERLAEVLGEPPAPPHPDLAAPPEMMRHHHEMEFWGKQVQIAADRRMHELMNETIKLKKAAQADYDAGVNKSLAEIEFLSATLYRVIDGVRTEDLVILDP